MYFVKTENLTPGKITARPVFNKRGEIAIDRNTKLDERIIALIKNSGLIGIYVLEPAETLPLVSQEDKEFEKFQFMNAYAVSHELQQLIKNHRIHRLEYIADEVIETFGKLRKRINFSQDVRSKDDFVYKHTLNVSILASIIVGKLGLTMAEKRPIINACLLHDIGKTLVPAHLLEGETPDEIVRILDNSQDTGFELIDEFFPDDSMVKEICMEAHQVLTKHKFGREQSRERVHIQTGVLIVAETFDELTAMDITGLHEPKTYVSAIRYMMEYPDIFPPQYVNTLLDSIQILSAGTSVYLSNGNKALVTSENPGNVLYPVVLEFNTNKMIDLSNREASGGLEVVDLVRNMDDRYSFNK